MARVTRLHQHFAGQACAARAPAHLHQLREKPFARAEVVRKQRGVGVQHADQRHAPEVMPLRDHLRADENIDLARMHIGKERLRAAFAARAVSIDAQHARARHRARKRLFDALRAASERRDIDVAALRARARNARLPAAVMATQRAFGLMQHDIGAAARAAGDPAARIARQLRRVAAAVEKHQALPHRDRAPLSTPRAAARTSLPPTRAPRRRSSSRSISLDARQRRIGDRAVREGQAPVAALIRLPPAFQRRRRRTEHDRNAELLGAPDRQIAAE